MAEEKTPEQIALEMLSAQHRTLLSIDDSLKRIAGLLEAQDRRAAMGPPR